jgi:HAD superfamily hydrolase (TIGR01509 family)
VVETGQMQLKPGAKEILQYLKGQEIPVGLASSSPRRMIDKVLQRHDVLRYFDVIVSGDMVEHGKPDPEIFLTCAAQMGISSEGFKETYVIEDSHNGIRAAFDAGMQPVMVPDRLAPNEEMRQKAAVILPSLNDLIAWLHDRG